jgi:ParB/RepB/Spo0J family partition protein
MAVTDPIYADLQVVEVPTDSLQPNPYNPNQQSLADFDLLVKSMQEDGFTTPIAVNDGTLDPTLKDMIIDGEHRWRAAFVLKMPTVPIVYLAKDQAGMRASTIRHNRARGHHDQLLESLVLKDLAESGVSAEELQEGLGVDPVELEVMLAKANDAADALLVADELEDEILAGLEERGITGEEAQIVAARHAVIGAQGQRDRADDHTRSGEVGKDVRLEFVYSGEEAAFMQEFVRRNKTGLQAVMACIRWFDSHQG